MTFQLRISSAFIVPYRELLLTLAQLVSRIS